MQTGRQYVIDFEIVEIPQAAVDRFISWNSPTFSKNVSFDRELVQYLLVRCSKMTYLKKGRINEDVIQFVTGEKVLLILCTMY